MINFEILRRLLESGLPDEVEILGPDRVNKIVEATLNGIPGASQFRSSNAPGHANLLEVINTVAAVGSLVCAMVPLLGSGKLSREQVLARLGEMTGAKPLTAKQRERVADSLLAPP